MRTKFHSLHRSPEMKMLQLGLAELEYLGMKQENSLGIFIKYGSLSPFNLNLIVATCKL